MPMLFFLKNPPITLAAKKKLRGLLAWRIKRMAPSVKLTMIDGMRAIIFHDGNIAYVKETTDEHIKAMQEKKEQDRKGPNIQQPSMIFPGRGGRRKN